MPASCAGAHHSPHAWCVPVVSLVPGGALLTRPLPGPKELSAPTNLTFLRIGLGHGLQNYTCKDFNPGTNASSVGALAVLYDVTEYYPGRSLGLSADAWNDLPSQLLFGQDIPLNLQNPSAGLPGSDASADKASEAGYGAVVANPFIADADLNVAGFPALKFLGRHYFDANGSPTFDLTAAALLGSVAKFDGIPAPSGADPGILETSAVDWLRLNDNLKGISKGVQSVYRVITAGGGSETCDSVGASSGSVPYAAFYYFYGPAPSS